IVICWLQSPASVVMGILIMTGTLRQVMMETWKHPDLNRILGIGPYCRPCLWLLPSLPWNRLPIRRRSALAHDPQQRGLRYTHNLSKLVIVSAKEGAHGSCGRQ